MQESIFSKIIRGEVPAYRIYEDEKTIAFLDIHPIQPGHTLVVPKRQIDSFIDLKDSEFADLMIVAQKIAKHLKQTLGCKRVVLNIDGFDVPHVHIHLVPVNKSNENHREGRMSEDVDHEALRSIQQLLTIQN